MAAAVGTICHPIDRGANNLLTGHVRHSAAETNGTSAQSYRHSVVRCRRRPSPEAETSTSKMPNGTNLAAATCRSASRSVAELARQFELNGTASRVDSSDPVLHKMTHRNGFRTRNRCQQDSREKGVQDADSELVLATSSESTAKTSAAGDDSRQTSDGLLCEINDRTVANTTVSNASPNEPHVNGFSDESCSLNGLAAIEYSKPNSNGTLTISDARNGQIVQVPRLTACSGALAKVGDVDREREIERRMRELGLWESKRNQERHLAELLDNEISARDGLTAALRRCRRRQRGQAASAADDIRYHVNHNFIRNAWGAKVAYEVRILMGCFTRDVEYMTSDHVVTVRSASADPGVKLTKEMTIELPAGIDTDDVTVTYAGGVVRIQAPFSRSRRRNLARSSTRTADESSTNTSVSSS